MLKTMFWKYQKPKTRESFRVLLLLLVLELESGVCWGSEEEEAEGGEGKWDLGLKGKESNLDLVNGIWRFVVGFEDSNSWWVDAPSVSLRKEGFMRGLGLRRGTRVEEGRRFKANICVVNVGAEIKLVIERER